MITGFDSIIWLDSSWRTSGQWWGVNIIFIHLVKLCFYFVYVSTYVYRSGLHSKLNSYIQKISYLANPNKNNCAVLIWLSITDRSSNFVVLVERPQNLDFIWIHVTLITFLCKSLVLSFIVTLVKETGFY